MSLWSKIKNWFSPSSISNQDQVFNDYVEEAYRDSLSTQEQKLEKMDDKAFLEWVESHMTYTQNRLEEISKEGDIAR